MLYLPKSEVASLTPVYPSRWRVATSAGRVGHVPRLGETRFWVALGSSGVTPRWLVREGESWRAFCTGVFASMSVKNAHIADEHRMFPFSKLTVA